VSRGQVQCSFATAEPGAFSPGWANRCKQLTKISHTLSPCCSTWLCGRQSFACAVPFHAQNHRAFLHLVNGPTGIHYRKTGLRPLYMSWADCKAIYRTRLLADTESTTPRRRPRLDFDQWVLATTSVR
jgi:hypothetical protein